MNINLFISRIIFFIICIFQFSPPVVLHYNNESFPLYYALVYFIFNNLLIVLVLVPALFDKTNVFINYINNVISDDKIKKIMFIFILLGSMLSVFVNTKILLGRYL